jgi:hypothetical protein
VNSLKDDPDLHPVQKVHIQGNESSQELVIGHLNVYRMRDQPRIFEWPPYQRQFTIIITKKR